MQAEVEEVKQQLAMAQLRQDKLRSSVVALGDERDEARKHLAVVEQRCAEQLGAESEELQRQKAEASKLLEVLESRLATASQTLQERQQQFLEVQQALEQASSRCDQHRVEVEGLCEALESSQRWLAHSKQQLQGAERRCLEPLKAVHDLEEELRVSVAELEGARLDHGRLKRELRDSETRCEERSAQLGPLEIEQKQLHLEKEGLHEALESSQKQLAHSKQQLQDAERRCQERVEGVHALEEKLRLSVAELESARLEHQRLQQELGRAETRCEERTDILEGKLRVSVAELDDARLERERLQGELSDSETRCEERTAQHCLEVGRVREALGSSQMQLAQCNLELQDVERRREASIEVVHGLEEKLRLSVAELEGSRIDRERLARELNDAETRCEERSAQLGQLEIEQKELHLEKEGLHEALESSQKQLAHSNQQLQDAERRCQERVEAVHALEEKLRLSVADLEHAGLEHERLQQELGRAETRCEERSDILGGKLRVAAAELDGVRLERERLQGELSDEETRREERTAQHRLEVEGVREALGSSQKQLAQCNLELQDVERRHEASIEAVHGLEEKLRLSVAELEGSRIDHERLARELNHAETRCEEHMHSWHSA